MSWVERELNRRAQTLQPSTHLQSTFTSEPARMQELWNKFKDTNSALPNAIQLRLEIGSPFPDAGENAMFVEWLRAQTALPWASRGKPFDTSVMSKASARATTSGFGGTF